MSERQPVALITAGSAGLGAATARLFAKDGMRVVVNYNTGALRAEKLVEELRGLSPLPDSDENFLAIKADLSKREEIVKLVEDAVAGMGRLDVVFSNGGWTHIRGWESLDDNVIEEDWDKCFNMNVKSHLFLMHAVKKYLDQTEGAFITTSSLAGVKVSGSSLAYAVTKAAQIHLAKCLAVLAAPKIRVNSVSPGLMMTDWGKQFSEEAQQRVLKRSVLGRLATVEDVAEQVLCYAKCKSMTGVNAIIDGGMHL